MGIISSRGLRVPSWVTYAIHIETVFFVGVVLVIIYFIWFYDDSKVSRSEKIADLADELLSVPKGKKGEKIKREGKPSFPQTQSKRFNKHEERCREIFQDLFNRPFKTIRPNWLMNPISGKNLELDGFNSDIPTKMGMGLAFEYDGQQHSKYNSHFHKGGPLEFVYQTKRDSWKDLKCKERGVLLIRIPYFVPYEDLERWIKQRLFENGLVSEPNLSKRTLYD